MSEQNGMEVATIAGGCFWCIEAVFDDLRGVTDVVSGYTGGHVRNPTYEQVCGKRTGHAEALLKEKKISAIPDWKKVLRSDFMEKARAGS